VGRSFVLQPCEASCGKRRRIPARSPNPPASASNDTSGPRRTAPLAASATLARSRATRLAGAITIHDATLRQVVRRHLEIHAVTRENLDPVPAQTPRDVREDRVAVLEFDGERRARKHLLDRAEELESRFFRRLGSGARGGNARSTSGAGGYGWLALRKVMPLVYPTGATARKDFGPKKRIYCTQYNSTQGASA
jgi:hypothetical protein